MSTQSQPGLLRRLAGGSLVKQILVGLVLGILLALVSKDAALAAGAESAPGYPVLSLAIRAGCRAAIALSKRI